ncbi:hypothetical protein D3C87_1534740 [compost metagenome]
MKKILLLGFLLIVTFCIGYYFYTESDKYILKKFSNEIVKNTSNVEDIIEEHVKYTNKGKTLGLYVLNFIKQEYKKNKGQIIIYSREEAKKYRQDKIVLKEKEKLYYVKFNNEMIFPFIVNNDSKIIVLMILTKGSEGTLSESRSDQ